MFFFYKTVESWAVALR